jgi:hypothetical protein
MRTSVVAGSLAVMAVAMEELKVRPCFLSTLYPGEDMVDLHPIT